MMKSSIAMIVLLLFAAGHVIAAEMKVPAGCMAVKGATPVGDTGSAATDGYASRVIHQKSGIELILCPPGSLSRAKKVTIGGVEVTFSKPFYVGRTEVTNGQYRKFLSARKAAGNPYDGRRDVDPAYDTYLAHFRGISITPGGDDYPVVFVSWLNARAFCKWAGLELPSEAEWEFACRAGTTTPYHFGGDAAKYPQYGWALKNSGATTHKVAGLKPNNWGLHDMHGNVYEWCLDDYADGPVPPDGSPHVDAMLLTKSVRGGAWTGALLPSVGMSQSRFSSAPRNTHNDLGFRVVLRLP